jgi:tetratricopeptide (TPR) repeat protein
MRKTNLTIIISLAFAIFLTGCSAYSAKPEFDKRIKTAFVQLQDGHNDEAMENLRAAQQLSRKKGSDQTKLKRLSVEAYLRVGDHEAAYEHAKELLESQPQDPYVNELMGKVLLKQGQYTKAEGHFIQAKESYRASADVIRVADLVALVRYLVAYEAGDPRLAEQHRQEIQDEDFKQAVDKTRKEVLTGSS